ncbi:MAG: hypothetical protein RJA35_580, partial [Actinomycetota bacterium]
MSIALLNNTEAATQVTNEARGFALYVGIDEATAAA